MPVSPLSPTFSAGQISAAAFELMQRRQQGQIGSLLADACRPQGLADALAIQLQVSRHFGTVVGWKCGLPSTDAAGQQKIVLGPLYQHELSQGPKCSLWPSAAGLARVEPEYAYPLLADLPPGDTLLSDTAVAALLGTPHQALELIQSRYQGDAGALYPDQLADGLFNQGVWLGPQLTQAERAAFPLQLTPAGGVSVTHAARHPNDNPRAPLPWVINFLRGQGISLKAGQFFITGSFAGVLELPFATEIRWQYGNEPPFHLSFYTR